MVNPFGDYSSFDNNSYQPSWSPTKDEIVLIRGRGLIVIDSNGNLLRTIIDDDPGIYPYISPTWPPDGNKIAHLLEQDIHILDVIVRNADGSNPIIIRHQEALFDICWY